MCTHICTRISNARASLLRGRFVIRLNHSPGPPRHPPSCIHDIVCVFHLAHPQQLAEFYDGAAAFIIGNIDAFSVLELSTIGRAYSRVSFQSAPLFASIERALLAHKEDVSVSPDIVLRFERFLMRWGGCLLPSQMRPTYVPVADG